MVTLFALSLFIQAASPDMFVLKVEDPELKPWGEKARSLMIEWYPKIAMILGVKEAAPKEKITIEIETHGDGVAGTSGRHIGVNGDYVRAHPEDIGLVVHELAHVVQSYPHYYPSWLVEGIADYVRWFNYEPLPARPRVDPDKATYTNGYRDVGAFLDWLVGKYDKKIVVKLDTALRANTYKVGMWEDVTGKMLPTLWREFLADVKKGRSANPGP